MDPIIFDVEGIKKLLQNLDCKKANGPDNIPTRLIKDTASEIADVVSFLFNQSYSLSQLPADWCKANIVPIFKKGAKQHPNNYRPVSLTVALCKVMEHVIYQSIMQHLEHNSILYSKQHSLRKNHSCETQLLLTIEDLAKNLDEGSEIDLQIFDFRRPLTRYPTRDYSQNWITMEFRERHSLGLIRGLQRDFSVSLWMVKLLALLTSPQEYHRVQFWVLLCSYDL